jgi:hypothetical protein
MRFVALSFAILAVEMPVPVATAATDTVYPPLFTTEMKAQQHCPSDIVVWLTVPSGTYHFKGQLGYGDSDDSAYVCKNEADMAGDRPTEDAE